LGTDFVLCYPDAENVRRGPFVDRTIRPDIEFDLDGIHYLAEIDTGQQSHRAVRRRQLAYRDYRNFLLYVSLSERRRQGLIKRCHLVKDVALFGVLEDVQKKPRGKVWVDGFGKAAAI
jgi:hypothetical protein